jgi:crotonobetainyl-CoA:carnitine CoA-transferase CaiB-like acyl-CoA transferase
MPSEQPFAGLEVVEFGQFIAVPFCAQLLSEGGAHVIKVESLAGDPTRQLLPLAPGETRHFISRNRGKHSLPLDLRHPAAARIVLALVARADVVLTNFRPGLAAELGLDYASLAPRYPRLIVGNVTAFGPRGPDASLAGMDLVVQARSGLMASNGRLRDGRPVAGDPPVADYMCAMMLSFGIASALLRRANTGRGGEVDVALLMAALLLQNNAMLRVAADRPEHVALLEQLGRMRAEGAPYAEQSQLAPEVRPVAMGNVYYRTYATRDAAIAVACASPALQRAMMRAVGLTDPAHERPLAGRAEQARHYQDLGARMEALIASRSTAEWKAAFDAHGVPAAGVKLPIELLDDEQVLANRMVHDVDHPAIGPVRVLANPVRLDRDGFVPAPITPAFGSEVRDLLGAAGFSVAEIDSFIADGVTRESIEKK